MGDFRILIVEDEGILAMNEQRLLVRLGYQVCGVADNGESAVEMAKRHMPDFILMDIRIRGSMDGVQTAECIRRFSDAPILFTTAYSDEDTLMRSSKTAFTSYLFKPYQIRDLQAAIESYRTKLHGEGRAHKQERHVPENVSPVSVSVDAGQNGHSLSLEGKE
jgi:two-component system, response regulator PdtaR